MSDTSFSYRIGYFAKSIGVNHTKAYCVTDSPGSVSKNQTKEVQYIRTKVFAEKNRFLYEHAIPVFDHYLLKPVSDCATNRDWKSMLKCLSIARRYGFSAVGLLMRSVAPNRIKPFVKLGLAKRFKDSFNC